MLLTLFINMFILHMGTMEVRFMSISGVGNNYSFNASNIGNNSSSRVSGEQKKFNVDKEYKLQANSVLSTVRIETGESIGIFYDETSTKSNPVMLAKIIDADGSENEMKININDVNPSDASYVEMLALSAHLKTEGKIDGPAGAFATMVFNARVKEANERNIYAKEDFMPAMKEMVNDALKDGRMDTYLRYLKELDIYSNWGKKSN